MSAEGPVRKPSGSGIESVRTSDPPDVDSLMSRLDGDEAEGRASDPGDGNRPSAAELLSAGRTRGRTKRTIRVPDDAVPAGTPPTSSRRSNPPPSMPSPIAEDLLQRTSFIPLTPQRIISVGEGPPPTFPVPSSSQPLPSTDPRPSNPRVEADFVSPPQPRIDADFISSPRLEADAASPGPMPAFPPTSDVHLAAMPAAPAPTPQPEQAKRTLTVPNLDAQVREALALLDREDFEVPVDITEAEEEPKSEMPASNEESLADEELEVVDAGAAVAKLDGPQPAKKVVTAPTPPPRRASASQPNQVIANTLPSAASTSSPPPANSEPTSQPRIVVAAAATVASTPAAGAMGPAPAPASPTPSNPSVDPGGEVKKKKRQWFEELFNDDFARTLPKLDERYIEREVKFIEDALGCDKGATILDLGCGPGEQAVALAIRGYEVIGIDLSLAMLARAADEAAEKNQRINFLQGDMRDLTFDDAFDGIYCWGTTFGYFDDTKNAEVIQKIHKALRRGGRFLLDVVNRDYIAARMPSMVWFEGDGCVCMDEAQLNGITSRLNVKRTMMMEDGRQREIEYSIRLYALHELGKVLHDNGFRVAEASGDTSTPGSYFGSESPRILILAEKR